MLSTIKEESGDNTGDDVIFMIDNPDDSTVICYSCIASIFASQSPIFNKLITKYRKNKKKKKKQSKEIYLKYMTLNSFCFIRNTFYELNPSLTYHDVVDVLYSSIKYQIKPIIKECVDYLLDIDNMDNYWIVIQSFAVYPRLLFESWFNNNFCQKSPFFVQHINEIIASDNFITYSSLFQMEIICQFMVSEKLITHQTCYQLISKWCRYQFNHKFKPLISMKNEDEYIDDNISVANTEITGISEISTSVHEQNALNISSVTLNTSLTASDDVIKQNNNMIQQWQDLIDDFIPFIDFVDMDLEFLLTQIRSDHIMTQQDLLSILLQKYEKDKNNPTQPILSNKRNKQKHKIIGATINGNKLNQRRVSTSSNRSNISILSGSSCSSFNMEVFKTNDTLLTKKDLQSLSVGHKVDIRDNMGRYLKAEIIEMDEFQDNRIKIHFSGWSRMWDKWIDIDSNNDYQCITHFGYISDREIQKSQLRDLSIGDTVIVKLPHYHKHHGFGWLSAEIINMDKGQLNVQYTVADDSDTENDIHEYWIHADNIDECR